MRPHTSRRRSIGVSAESMPNSVTPRRMNGSTVVGRSAPPTLPLAATAPTGCERGQHVRERGATDRVDRTRPARRLQRLADVGELVAVDDLSGRRARGGTARPRPCPCSAATVNPRPASIATAMLPTPPVAPVTSTVPAPGDEPVVEQREHRQRRGVAGGADDHRLTRREAVGQRHDPARRHPCHLGVPAVVRDAEVVAVGEHRVARRRSRRRRSTAPCRPGRCRARSARCGPPGPSRSRPGGPCS